MEKKKYIELFCYIIDREKKEKGREREKERKSKLYISEIFVMIQGVQ